MSDEILDRIDAVLGHEDTVIADDWSVSGDAMRSRPPTDGDTPYDPEVNAPKLTAGVDLGPRRGNGAFYDGANFSATPPRAEPIPRGRVLELLETLGLTPHLERVCVGISRLITSIRPSRPRRTGARTVTVTLTADTRAFTEALSRCAAALNQVGYAAIMSAPEFAAIQAELADQIDRCLDLALAKASMRRLARRETVLARVWLGHHVDAIYADLGLDRPNDVPLERHNVGDQVDAMKLALTNLARPQEEPTP